jgi:hypothetical protein
MARGAPGPPYEEANVTGDADADQQRIAKLERELAELRKRLQAEERARLKKEEEARRLNTVTAVVSVLVVLVILVIFLVVAHG